MWLSIKRLMISYAVYRLEKAIEKLNKKIDKKIDNLRNKYKIKEKLQLKQLNGEK